MAAVFPAYKKEQGKCLRLRLKEAQHTKIAAYYSVKQNFRYKMQEICYN
jgi:hypothetical protein